MTEEEWDGTPTAGQMLHAVHRHLRIDGRLLRRKYRLFTCYVLRMAARYSTDARFSQVIDLAERCQLGEAKWADVIAATTAACLGTPIDTRDAPVPVKLMAALRYLTEDIPLTGAHQAIGPVAYTLAGRSPGDEWDPNNYDREQAEWRKLTPLVREMFDNPFRPVAFDPRWRTSTAIGLADTMFRSGAFDRMPILADALQDAGCEDAAVLVHCRDAGEHVRGCWVVDHVLGK